MTSLAGSWSSAKLFIMQNYTDNANGNVPFNNRKFVIFSVSLSSRCAHVLWEEKQNWSNVLLYDDNVNQLR